MQGQHAHLNQQQHPQRSSAYPSHQPRGSGRSSPAGGTSDTRSSSLHRPYVPLPRFAQQRLGTTIADNSSDGLGNAFAGPSRRAYPSPTQESKIHFESSQSQIKPEASTTEVTITPPKVSCLECRSSKVKCLPCSNDDPPGSRCARCTRIDKECVYEKHKRGRKPDAVKYGKLEKQLESILQELRSEKESKTPSEDGDRDDNEPAAKRIRAETAEILTNWSSSVARSQSASSGQPTRSPRAAANTLIRALEERRQGCKTKKGGSVALKTEKTDDTLTGGSGLHSLSNPLKLLAQASAGDEDDDEADSSRNTNAADADAMTARRHSNQQLTAGPRAEERNARSTRDILGIYDPRHEVGPNLDPIDLGLISLQGAKQLWEVFQEKLSHPLMLLDRKLYTFEYCRPRSSMLLSVGLALTARFIPSTQELPTDEIAEALDKHVLQVLIPTVLLEGKRSVHCCKAFLLLAAYNGQSIPLSEDRSYSYVSWAFAMCVELDINRKMVSIEADPEDETLQRQLRDRERTFFTAWAFSFSLALHHGRRCSLAIHDPVVAASNEWHRNKFALPEDAGLVSNLQLRKLIARNLDYYLQHVAPLMPKSPADGVPDEACRLLLEFHRKSITDDLDGWHAAWVLPEAAATRTHDSSQANGQQRARPLRLQSTAFYHSYATLILHSLPLKSGSEDDPILRPFRRKADEAAVSCVALFLRLSRDQIIWGHNSPFVTVGFAAVYALRAPDPGLSVVEMVKQVIGRMEVAGNVTPHRKSFATGYAVFLRKLVRIHEMRTAKQQRLQHGGQAPEEGNVLFSGYTPNDGSWRPPSSGSLGRLDSTSDAGKTVTSGAGYSDAIDQQASWDGAASSSSVADFDRRLSDAASEFQLPSHGLGSAAMSAFHRGNASSVASALPSNGPAYHSGPATTLAPAASGLQAPVPSSFSNDLYWNGNGNGSEPPPSQAALMDDLVMTQPLGLQLNSLLDLDNFGWDWPLFTPATGHASMPPAEPTTMATGVDANSNMQ